jgi:2-phosphosulfolactate phosphatase
MSASLMVRQPSITVAWGLNGLRSARDRSVCVIVDVLSFSSAVVAGCSNGGIIFPYRWRDERARQFAVSVGAELAVQRQDGRHSEDFGVPPSLSPVSLAELPTGYRLVLPSPNGSALATESQADFVVAGCLRNASAVARWLNRQAQDVAVVAAGERWPDGSLRVALEDMLGAGAIVAGWHGKKCVEASAAEATFHRFSSDLQTTLLSTASGRELTERGFAADVVLPIASSPPLASRVGVPAKVVP